MTDTATLQSRLDEAEQALHDLTVGNKPSAVAGDGERIEYRSNPQSVAELRSYIAELKRQLGQSKPRGYASPRFRRC